MRIEQLFVAHNSLANRRIMEGETNVADNKFWTDTYLLGCLIKRYNDTFFLRQILINDQNMWQTRRWLLVYINDCFLFLDSSMQRVFGACGMVFPSLGLAVRKQGSPSDTLSYIFHIFDVSRVGWQF
jgi:hypothetical protein